MLLLRMHDPMVVRSTTAPHQEWNQHHPEREFEKRR